MELEQLGYNKYFEKFRIEKGLTEFDVGRVIAEHKERYIVRTENAELEAEIVGNFRFSARERADFPAVGDWVALSLYDNNKALIHTVYDRRTIIERKAVGKQGEVQIIAANVDYAFIIQAIDRDFNINRLERYLTICNSAAIKPLIVLSKIDLISVSDLMEIIDAVKERISETPVIAVSNETLAGYDLLNKYICSGYTYCMLGSSGVGKSTLLNNLSGNINMKTDSISQSTQKGRHTTSHRELIVLADGGILIDNPGMREVGIVDKGDGLKATFETILKLSEMCKFSNCTHVAERGCAVLKALDEYEIDQNTYDNYIKMEREKKHFELSLADRRKKDKDFGKMVKHFKKSKDQNNL